jgi:hypothetical protein
MIFRLLNVQGIAGIATSLALAALLIVQKAETRHWKKQSTGFELFYRQEQAAFAGTAANYRAAADQARAADAANAERVAIAQRRINERTAYDYETRLAAARAAAQRLRVEAAAAAADPGARRGAPVPGLSAASRSVAQAAGQDGLSQSEHRPQAEVTPLGADDALTATEQAIQLDELITWIRAQAKVDNHPQL